VSRGTVGISAETKAGLIIAHTIHIVCGPLS